MISERDGASLSIRNWFHDAFPSNIAQIYSGGAVTETPAFPTHRLGAADRRFGRVFSLLKGQAQKAEELHESVCVGEAQKTKLNGLIMEIPRRLGKLILSMGIWEIVFKPRISPELDKFIQDFAPDVVVAQGFDLGFTWLPVQIHEQFGVPITTIIVDDWEPYLYRDAPRFLGMRGVVRRAFVRLLRKSDRRYCISAQMAREYGERYGLPFEVLMQTDHRRLLNSGRAKTFDPCRFVVAYSGSLGLKRWEGLRDLADALATLSKQGVSGELRVYAPSLPAEAVSLQRHHMVKLFPHLPDAQVLPVLSEADVVFLPESFDNAICKYIRLSVSTKAHLYMMTGAVPLVYGPAGIGTVEYARYEKWGMVVSEQGAEGLIGALRSIVDDRAMADRIVGTALKVFEANHAPASCAKI
ncbi:glycosyltransferase [Luteimonas sp. FXH3W]|uniref:Glycosyltransferase n=1 Tax=Aquilutibacter rugosus TaxID=3115820 RepID=A0ABU7UW10_9GAMM